MLCFALWFLSRYCSYLFWQYKCTVQLIWFWWTGILLLELFNKLHHFKCLIISSIFMLPIYALDLKQACYHFLTNWRPPIQVFRANLKKGYITSMSRLLKLLFKSGENLSKETKPIRIQNVWIQKGKMD